MSVVGIDIGNLNSVVAVARKRGIDIIANEASRRETPTIVAFKDKQRYLGEQGSTQMMGNLPNSITDFKQLLGKKWSSKECQSLIAKGVPFKIKQMEGDTIGIEVEYQGETQVFSVEQITAMMLTQLRNTVEADSKGQIKVQEVVISVPTYFTDVQRRALRDAAHISGLNCLQLLSEPTALAVHYGMYKKDLPDESAPLLVLFVNFGHASTSATVVAFTNTTVRMLSCVYNTLGGRDLDEALFNHFAAEIKENYKLDISTNSRAQLRLRQQCERVKKVLTGNNEAPLYVESIMNEIDVRSMIKREDFERLTAPIWESLEKVVKQAIAEANLTAPLAFVEVVGGSSYVPIFQTRLKEITGMDLSHTQNKTENIARGCAIQCAVLSPQFHINSKVTVKDYVPYTIGITWSDPAGGDKKSAVLFKKGETLPVAKKISFKKPGLFISADYAVPEELPEGTPTMNIGTFQLPSFENTLPNTESTTYEVKFKLDSSGIFTLDFAQAVETYYEVVPPAEGEKPAAPAEGDAPAPDAKDPEGDTVMAESRKKRTKTTRLTVNGTYVGGLNAAVLKEYTAKEQAMQHSDYVAISTAEAKNALEGYAYDSQSKLQYEFADWAPYAKEEEKTKFLAAVDEVITWLYGEGDDTTKDVYESKLAHLRALGDPFELRKNQDEERGPAIEQLTQTFRACEEFVASQDEKYAHITEEDRKKVADRTNEVKEWFSKMEARQNALTKQDDPVLLSSTILTKKAELEQFAAPIINKPKPKPKEEPKPAPKEEAKTKTEGDAKPEQTPSSASEEIIPEVEELKDDAFGAVPTDTPASNASSVPEEMDVD